MLSAETLVADVCSVKTLPVRWMREALPGSVHVLATHPMFGPDSAASSLEGRKILLWNERVPPETYQKIRDYLAGRGLAVVEASPEEHDRQIALSLGLTHFIGRALCEIGAGPLEIDTEGYKRLLNILDVVTHDTWQLFVDMHRYNPFAHPLRQAFMDALNRIDERLER
jgi:prephenate dehydrogenase